MQIPTRDKYEMRVQIPELQRFLQAQVALTIFLKVEYGTGQKTWYFTNVQNSVPNVIYTGITNLSNFGMPRFRRTFVIDLQFPTLAPAAGPVT